MQITGVSEDAFHSVVRYVSTEAYEGNLVVRESMNFHGVRRPRIRAAVGCIDGKGEGDRPAIGARRSASGRRGPWACWHAFRDVLNVMFEQYPDAVVRTLLATYNGLDGFRETYPETAYKNVGSMFQPQYMPELCTCNSSRTDALSAPSEYVITFPI